LSDDHKHARQTICQEHLDRHAREFDAFLRQIVTKDESWMYHYEPESNRHSMQWKHPSSPANKKLKTQASAGKVMLIIFWDVNGPISVHFQE
jgi:acetylornithine deacetylase/succinyl-diaminopimelate desuccinylase-like protein